MIKIEKIAAQKATIVRGGVRQPLVLHSHITDAELATIEAESGTIVYTVDEAEIKELTFQAKQVEQPVAIKQPATRIVQPASKASKSSVEPTSPETQAE